MLVCHCNACFRASPVLVSQTFVLASLKGRLYIPDDTSPFIAVAGAELTALVYLPCRRGVLQGLYFPAQ